MLRRLLSLVVLAIAFMAVPLAAQAADYVTEAEDGFLAAINASRAEEGLDPLTFNAEVQAIARGWADTMAVENELYHNPDYAGQYTGEWIRMGENVGYLRGGGSLETARVVEALHEAFMDSPGHRANILGSYNQAGVGVVLVGDTWWVTVNFLQGPLLGDLPLVDDNVQRSETSSASSWGLPGDARRLWSAAS